MKGFVRRAARSVFVFGVRVGMGVRVRVRMRMRASWIFCIHW